MKLNIFIRENCNFCQQLEIPEDLEINVIDLDNGYEGFFPASIPVLQYNGINLEGPQVINSILQLVKESQNGNYKK